jgi:hypothetical protein
MPDTRSENPGGFLISIEKFFLVLIENKKNIVKKIRRFGIREDNNNQDDDKKKNTGLCFFQLCTLSKQYTRSSHNANSLSVKFNKCEVWKNPSNIHFVQIYSTSEIEKNYVLSKTSLDAEFALSE